MFFAAFPDIVRLSKGNPMQPHLQLLASPTISPYMITASHLLQMTSAEMESYIQKQLEENPLLDTAYNEEEYSFCGNTYPARTSQVKEKDTWRDRQLLETESSPESLYDHLFAQINLLKIPANTKSNMERMVLYLDTNGRLDAPLESIAHDLGVSITHAELVLSHIQRLEPTGVGARSLEECLLLQLNKQGSDTLSKNIVKHHLNNLAKCHYHAIAQSLGVDEQQVRLSCKKIRTLHPRPGEHYAAPFKPLYVSPDVVVDVREAACTISVIRQDYSNIRINREYCMCLQQCQDPTAQRYLKDKYHHAKTLIRSLNQRQETIQKVSEAIVELQAPFFLEDSKTIKPMILGDVARAVSLHTSTVSRAIKGKYLLSPKGMYPLTHFFERNVTQGAEGESCSASHIKKTIQALIQTEPPRKPLSDQKIVEALSKGGITLARRTVAKYRDSLGILPATARKSD